MDCNREERRGIVLDVKITKTLKMFISQHREEIDTVIRKACPNCRINDAERRLWILNDEFLYLWARGEGVKI